MNAVEIEQAISELAEQPFDPAQFPFQLLAAFGHKETALRRLRTGNSNLSDVTDAAVGSAVLLRNNLHIAVARPGDVGAALNALRASPANAKGKPKFLIATDGQTLEAEDLAGGDTLACTFADLPNHFGFLLPLAGISTIKEIKDNPIDVRATSRLNKLYVELLRENPDWATKARRADMNHFMARLIFCFFAEDTDIFNGEGLFTRTIEQFTERDGSNVDFVLAHIFRAMNIPIADRNRLTTPLLPSGEGARRADEGTTGAKQSNLAAKSEHTLRANPHPNPSPERRGALPLPNWANTFPYVNGGLFAGQPEAPRFTHMARTYLLHASSLDWKQINPDIFGSMIQAVADDEECGALGMHYTSVPNILKVLNPLFLDDLNAQLAAAGENKQKLLTLRRRMARIRVFDPACGSDNFLVIAYKQSRLQGTREKAARKKA